MRYGWERDVERDTDFNDDVLKKISYRPNTRKKTHSSDEQLKVIPLDLDSIYSRTYMKLAPPPNTPPLQNVNIKIDTIV